MKACSVCRKRLPLESYRVNRRRYDGRDYACRPCRRAQDRAHYAVHGQRIREAKRCVRNRATSVDHVVPLVRGGRHSIGNILPACGSCNSRKGVMTLFEWRHRMRRAEAA